MCMPRGYSNGPDGMVSLRNFSGENYGVARGFAESFNGEWVIVVILEFSFMQEFISEVMGLYPIVKIWFKGKTVMYIDFNPFLKDEHTDPEWQNGIPT